MAVRTTFVQDGAYNAPDFRFSQGVSIVRDVNGNVRSGLIDIGLVGDTVTPGGANNVLVGKFLAQAPDAIMGAYTGGNDAPVTVPVLTPEATNNRVDLLCWRPLEGLSTTSTGATTKANVTLAGSTSSLSKQVIHGELYFIKGTPSASTSPPAPITPSGSVPLARVYIPGGSTTVSASSITLVATYVSTQVGDGSAYVPAMRSIGTGANQAAAGNHSHIGGWTNMSVSSGFVNRSGTPLQARVLDGGQIQLRGSVSTSSSSAQLNPAQQFATLGAQTLSTIAPTKDSTFPVVLWSSTSGLAQVGFAILKINGAIAIYPSAAPTAPASYGISLDGTTVAV